MWLPSAERASLLQCFASRWLFVNQHWRCFQRKSGSKFTDVISTRSRFFQLDLILGAHFSSKCSASLLMDLALLFEWWLMCFFSTFQILNFQSFPQNGTSWQPLSGAFLREFRKDVGLNKRWKRNFSLPLFSTSGAFLGSCYVSPWIETLGSV